MQVCVIGVGLKQPMTSFLQQFTWLYFPDPPVPFFRVTIFSKYGEVTPDNNKFWSLMCECARPIDDEVIVQVYLFDCEEFSLPVIFTSSDTLFYSSLSYRLIVGFFIFLTNGRRIGFYVNEKFYIFINHKYKKKNCVNF